MRHVTGKDQGKTSPNLAINSPASGTSRKGEAASPACCGQLYWTSLWTRGLRSPVSTQAGAKPAGFPGSGLVPSSHSRVGCATIHSIPGSHGAGRGRGSPTAFTFFPFSLIFGFAIFHPQLSPAVILWWGAVEPAVMIVLHLHKNPKFLWLFYNNVSLLHVLHTWHRHYFEKGRPALGHSG